AAVQVGDVFGDVLGADTGSFGRDDFKHGGWILSDWFSTLYHIRLRLSRKVTILTCDFSF
ncbi:MAG: hypothetical protein IJF67_11935, partial [Clostridia bacterium]|nr:hypothetical protein [Clostridia bacterium]